ncbi:MAG TPA: glycosyltransferase [Burkholderiaceae bacterium]|nr:glycosyltransferase [Burkholderiaceae bacterium]
MARIMLAWELGAGSGHEAVSLWVADRLAAHGHEIVFAVHASRAARCRAAHRYLTLAVDAPQVAPSIPDPGNFAECIEVAGFLDRSALEAALAVWERALAQAAADLLIEDFAPTALLAARCRHLPALSVGAGFCVAPAWAPWPGFRHWSAVPPDRLLAAEYRALLACNAALSSRGLAPLGAMGELYAGSTPVLTTWPALDPYAGFRQHPAYLGPVGASIALPDASAASAVRRDAVAYLRWDPSGAAFPVLQALARAGVDTLAAVPDLGAEVKQALAGSSVRIEEWIADLGREFASARFAVTHGGQGATLQALAAGLPVLVVPTQAEQYLTGERIASLGLGHVVRPGAPSGELQDAIDALQHDTERLASRVRQFVAEQRAACVAAPDSAGDWLVQLVADRLATAMRPGH